MCLTFFKPSSRLLSTSLMNKSLSNMNKFAFLESVFCMFYIANISFGQENTVQFGNSNKSRQLLFCQDIPRQGIVDAAVLDENCTTIYETICWSQVNPQPQAGNNRVFYRCGINGRYSTWQCPFFQVCSNVINMLGCACR